MEIFSEDDEGKVKSSNRNAEKKWKLCDSKSQCNISENQMTEDNYETLNNSTIENLSKTTTTSILYLDEDSIKHVCQRVKSRNKTVSSAKRFKLM